MLKHWSPVLAVLILFAGCKPAADVESFHSGTAEVTRFVVIGDNFMSGYQDGALRMDHQQRSIGAMLGAQLEYAGGRTFVQYSLNDTASIGWHNKPWESWYVGASKLGDRVDCEGVVSMGPVKGFRSVAFAQGVLGNTGPRPNHNFSIPFATTDQFFQPSFGSDPFTTNQNPFYHHIASNPGVSTVRQDVLAQLPTFFSMWLGMENIYSFARLGGTGAPMISAAQFADHLDSLLVPLTANGGKGVIANIPDFRSFPYYTLIPWNGADLTLSKADSLNDIYEVSGLTHIVFQEGSNGFVIDDPAAPFGVRQMHAGEYITLRVPTDSMKCNYMGILFQTIPDQYALDSSEVAEIDAAVAAYNAVIAQKAVQYNLALVDVNSYLKRVESGIKWDGVDYNATFVSGGFYSLDGFHPHEKGYALLTNEFIKAINAKFSAAIPTLNCFDCTGVLFP